MTDFKYDGSYITDSVHSEKWKFDERVSDARAAALLGCSVGDLFHYVNKMFTIVNGITAVYCYDGAFRIYRLRDDEEVS